MLFSRYSAATASFSVLNALNAGGFRSGIIDDWGTIVCPSGTLMIDTTVYRRMDYAEEAGMKCTSANLVFSPVLEKKVIVKEGVGLGSLTSGLMYYGTGNIDYDYADEQIAMGSLTSGFEYRQSGTSPV